MMLFKAKSTFAISTRCRLRLKDYISSLGNSFFPSIHLSDGPFAFKKVGLFCVLLIDMSLYVKRTLVICWRIFVNPRLFRALRKTNKQTNQPTKTLYPPNCAAWKLSAPYFFRRGPIVGHSLQDFITEALTTKLALLQDFFDFRWLEASGGIGNVEK